MEGEMSIYQTSNLAPEIWDESPQNKGWSVAAARTETVIDRALADRALQAQLVWVSGDEKAAKMLELFASQNFNEVNKARKIHLLMAFWAIRIAILGALKRALDLAVSLFVFPLVAPVMLVTAIAIKLDSPGPVLFRQARVGKWGKQFACYKFRSMFIDAEARKAELMHLNEADEIVFKIAKDPRITRVGRVIRKLSIDELPQLFNVIKGDMSWVGPRPPIPYEVENYKYDHRRRLLAVPGITGLQQVSGRSTVTFNHWIELDLQYIQEQSLTKDMQILIKTIPAVISGRGAY